MLLQILTILQNLSFEIANEAYIAFNVSVLRHLASLLHAQSPTGIAFFSLLPLSPPSLSSLLSRLFLLLLLLLLLLLHLPFLSIPPSSFSPLSLIAWLSYMTGPHGDMYEAVVLAYGTLSRVAKYIDATGLSSLSLLFFLSSLLSLLSYRNTSISQGRDECNPIFGWRIA